MPLNNLLDIIFDARAKSKLEQMLAEVKDRRHLPRSFRSTGTTDDLRISVQEAVNKGHLSLDELARLVDQIEENGGQHIFLFNRTPEGRRRLTRDNIANAFADLPARPTAALYAAIPSSTRTYYKPDPNLLIVKQIRPASYWERSGSWTDQPGGERTISEHQVHRRAVNLLVINPANDEVEIRIDRVRGGKYDDLAIAYCGDFLDTLKHVLRIGEHIEPIPIWEHFNEIARDRTDTFMNVDASADPAVKQRMSNRREGSYGTDVRDHPDYVMDQKTYVRDFVNIFWNIDSDSGSKLIYTALNKVEVQDHECGKVYVSAKSEPSELEHVITRIRRFAR